MALKIIYDYSIKEGIVKFLVRLLGAILIFIAIATAILLLTISLVLILLPSLAAGHLVLPIWQERDALVDLIKILIGGTALIAVCLWLGQRLVREKRRLVLFLRRFGFNDATRTLTQALTFGLDKSLRLVTLDDTQIVPVGVAGATGLALPMIIGFAILVIIELSTALIYASKWVNGEVEKATVSPTDASMGAAFEAFFANFFMAIAFAMLMLFIAGIIIFVLSIVIGFGGTFLLAYLAIRRAEKYKKFEVGQKQDLDPLVQKITKRIKKTFCPKLIVVKVANDIWKDTVRKFASSSVAVVIDISEPSANLLWEITDLKNEIKHPWILVGKVEHLQKIVGGEAKEKPQVGEMLSLLDGEEVLVYSDDWKGQRRFAKALRSRLKMVTK